MGWGWGGGGGLGGVVSNGAHFRNDGFLMQPVAFFIQRYESDPEPDS